jgi:DNA-binding transcriptional LysR family regulator
LLVALHALIAERSVTRAAKRCGVTQSSMSYSLARLRARFEDPLLEKRGGVLAPTALALCLAPRLESALGELGQVLDAKDSFDPSTSTRRFRIASSDMFQLVALPWLVQELVEVAPGVDLVVQAESDSTRERLASGALDIAIDSSPNAPPPGIAAHELFRQRLVCIARRSHPGIAVRPSLAVFCALPHILVARDEDPGLIDRALEALGRCRRVVVRVPDYAAIGHIVGDSNAIAVVPELVATVLARTLPLQVYQAPLQLRDFGVALLWQKSRSTDPGLRWLRSTLQSVAVRVSKGRPGSESKPAARTIPSKRDTTTQVR